MSIADGQKSEVEVYITNVVIRLEGRVICTPLIALIYAKGNQTILGMDFLQKDYIVLNLKHRHWFFSDSTHRTYDFVKEVVFQEVQSRPNIEENTCLLSDDENKCLTPEQRNELCTLLKIFETVFEPGREPTPFTEHRINTGDSPPVSVPPYRLPPAKEDLPKKDLDKLLE
ncbi:transposon Tf2-6 polyprotein [Nephila pilipes]|uniref:Transposon Tf2-6 polyprotein n=1 Tax=Nephila pilipes TaxID=299642 RepID=A0A8X6MA52_NEPPI|nr:transposon Tf2-6 polyprotein [Nephila pilipes]